MVNSIAYITKQSFNYITALYVVGLSPAKDTWDKPSSACGYATVGFLWVLIFAQSTDVRLRDVVQKNFSVIVSVTRRINVCPKSYLETWSRFILNSNVYFIMYSLKNLNNFKTIMIHVNLHTYL